ncbi:class I SAM-dependent methyltransferase [Streptomyces sp. SP17BM10]|uniref:class I SAM-dependent methyltransferase n=1 Tax=Streptomyces sp. SP17BM10 TaxID=3002530 RepID=UPI002E78ABAD|nr:class I SAM-dependent methyltransferase [Streptomyces sp. SP17BM10]MEE1783478.1 class I SAM-dependent methyltransferase [Streptomyces sp. SP17BM10]
MSAPSYLPAMTLDQYLGHLAARHPQWLSALDPGRLGPGAAMRRLSSLPEEFTRVDPAPAPGNPLVHWTGGRELLRLATGGQSNALVLDVLGGEGLLARAAAVRPGQVPDGLALLTGDLSGPMVAAALAHGLPAVRQSADRLLLADGTVDAVLLAHGTHRIPVDDRPAVVAEAVRVLRPGGRVVLHDFEPHSPMAAFFRTVVDPHSAVRHDYPHFTRTELLDLFAPHPVAVRLLDVYDPFTVRAGSPEAAKAAMVAHLAETFALTEHFAELGPEQAWELLVTAFDHTDHLAGLCTPLNAPARPLVGPVLDGYVAEVPRVAVVAVAELRTR